MPSAEALRSCSQVMNLTTLQNYYMAAYAAVRASSPNCYVMVAPRTFEQDSMQNDSATPSSWQTFMSAGSNYTNVLLDIHKCANAARLLTLDACRLPRHTLKAGSCSAPSASEQRLRY